MLQVKHHKTLFPNLVMYTRSRSDVLFATARDCMPGGVSSPVRAYKAVGGSPVFIEQGAGAWIQDVDGNRYVDYVLSYGPLLVGHAHQEVVDAIQVAARKGTSFGACTEHESNLIRKIQSFMPLMERLRLVNSGTEAVMSALRLARAFTGRDKIIKCAGNYHGHADCLLVEAGSGVATLGLPNCPGIPKHVAEDTLVVPFNNLSAVEQAFEKHPGEIAAMIVEPVAGNMGVIPPADGYLNGLRQILTDQNALLIFDEVMTGFRVHPGGAQALYDVAPDLTTLGKVIGGGLPIGAYGGRDDIMTWIAPEGSVYQAGTLSGNPIAVQAGLATLNSGLNEWDYAASQAALLMNGLGAIASDKSVPMQVNGVGTMFSCFFTGAPVMDWDTASTSNVVFFAKVFRQLLIRGVHLAPSQYEAWFMSTVHDSEAIKHTLDAFDEALEVVLNDD